MGNPIGELVLSGNLLIALPIALLAGIVSFASPCVLPLVPGYLGYIGGFTSMPEKPERRRLYLGVALGGTRVSNMAAVPGDDPAAPQGRWCHGGQPDP